MPGDKRKKPVVRAVRSAVNDLDKQGYDAVVIAVDKNGYFAQDSNRSRNFVAFILEYTTRKIYKAIEEQRNATNSQNH